MAEGEKDREHSPVLPPIADREGGASPNAPETASPESKSGKPSGMRRRIALLVGLLLATAILYLGLLSLLYRDKPDLELFYEAAGSQPPLDLTLNVISVDPVREVINVRIELAKPSESRTWRTLQPADIRDYVIHVDDRFLTFQIAAERSGAVLEVGLHGSISGYPLDHYSGSLSVSVSKKGVAAPQPVRLTVWPLVANWNVDISRSAQAPETSAGIDLDIAVKRPASFVVLAFAFYTAMAVIGLSGLTIGILVFLGVRPVEASLTGALGAMIFSIPALRGIMPGAPPLGVHADALILVWAQLAVILGLTLFVSTWVSRGSAARR